MRVAVTLPSFRQDAGEALDMVRRAEHLGLHGAFVFDHLWPIGRPDRPALAAFPLLGALCAATTRICLGPLVARVGVVPDDVLVSQLLSLEALAPGRIIAGLGTGDAKSAPENAALGIEPSPPAERRRRLRDCARSLRDQGIPVWIGGGAPATVDVAAELGVAINLWEATAAEVAEVAQRAEVTWAGLMPGPPAAMAQQMSELERAGATWVVCASPGPLDDLAEALALEG